MCLTKDTNLLFMGPSRCGKSSYPDTAVEDDNTDRKLVGMLELCDLSGLVDSCGGLD